MKYLKKILFAASLAVASLGFTSFSANAVLITQDIVDDTLGTVATLTIDIDDTLLGNGIISTSDLTLTSDFFVFGFPVDADPLLSFFTVFDFQVAVDGDDIFSGIQLFSFDGLSGSTAASIFMNTAVPGFNLFTVFDISTLPPTPLFASGGNSISFGQATFVSEPSVLALFGLALAAMGFRRRAR